MLFCAKANTTAVQTADTGKIRLGGGFRLPASTTDTVGSHPDGGVRPPASTADSGKIRLGGGFRLPVTNA